MTRRWLGAAAALLGLTLILPVFVSAEAIKTGKGVRTIRRNNARTDDFRSRVDDRIDDRREDRIENREDWQDHWDEDEERRERERLQSLREGTHGKACIYGANGEVIHAPAGAVCDRPPGPRPASTP